MSDAIDKLQDLWFAWDQGSMIGMADTINAIRPALDEMAEARAEIARLTAERDQAVAHRAATNEEIKRLHAVIKAKGFSVEESIALHETRSEVARLAAELARVTCPPARSLTTPGCCQSARRATVTAAAT